MQFGKGDHEMWQVTVVGFESSPREGAILGANVGHAIVINGEFAV